MSLNFRVSRLQIIVEGMNLKLKGYNRVDLDGQSRLNTRSVLSDNPDMMSDHVKEQIYLKYLTSE